MHSGERLVQNNDYRDVLRSILEERGRKNPRYSLRAFARDLGITPSRLSDVLKGRYGLSREASHKIAERLGFNSNETEFFCNLAESEHARSQTQRQLAKIRLKKFTGDSHYQMLQMDTFHLVADWYHMAILELTYLKGFKSNLTWIANALGISRPVAEQAVARLKRLGLLTEKNGVYRATEARSRTPDEVPSDAIKKFHQGILERAIAALYTQSVEDREFRATVVAIPRSKIAEAKIDIRKFQRALGAKLSGRGQPKNETKDDVFVFSTQLFSLTHQEKNHEPNQ
jgi:uncharacterized protein (TIGR02147 family)